MKCEYCGKEIGLLAVRYTWLDKKNNRAMHDKCYEKYINEAPEKRKKIPEESMKWYLKFPIEYIVIVCICSLTVRILYGSISLYGIIYIMIFCLFILGIHGLSDYVEKSKKRIVNASESEKKVLIAKDKKIQRIIILISLIIIIIAIALAYILTR